MRKKQEFYCIFTFIFTLGHLPYPDMGPHEVSEKIHTGYRMPQPPHCSGDMYVHTTTHMYYV